MRPRASTIAASLAAASSDACRENRPCASTCSNSVVAITRRRCNAAWVFPARQPAPADASTMALSRSTNVRHSSPRARCCLAAVLMLSITNSASAALRRSTALPCAGRKSGLCARLARSLRASDANSSNVVRSASVDALRRYATTGMPFLLDRSQVGKQVLGHSRLARAGSAAQHEENGHGGSTRGAGRCGLRKPDARSARAQLTNAENSTLLWRSRRQIGGVIAALGRGRLLKPRSRAPELDDLRVDVGGVGGLGGPAQVALQVGDRRAEALELRVDQAAVAQLLRGLWQDEQQPLHHRERLLELAVLGVDALQVAKHARDDVARRRRREKAVEIELAGTLGRERVLEPAAEVGLGARFPAGERIEDELALLEPQLDQEVPGKRDALQ